MTEQQIKAFDEAQVAARVLMQKLYALRYSFKLDATGACMVWDNVPNAQTKLTEIDMLIADARNAIEEKR